MTTPRPPLDLPVETVAAALAAANPRGALNPDGRKAAARVNATRTKQHHTAKDPVEPETEALYQRLMTLLWKTKEPAAVAAEMGWTPEGLEVFLTQHRSFARFNWDPARQRIVADAKLAKKAAKAGVVKIVAKMNATHWTDEVRKRLIDAYVDTGDLLSAQEAVGVTPSQFNAEVEANPEFGERVKRAKSQAMDTLQQRAIREGLGGNDKLMTLILRKDGDDAGVSQMSDAQLARRLTGLLGRIASRLAAAGDTGDAGPGRAVDATGGAGGSRGATPAQ